MAAVFLLLVLKAPGASAADPVRVTTTIKPVHSLVAAVMQGLGQPELLLDGSMSPHTYALKPSDRAKLTSAQVVVLVSPSLEGFMGKVLAALPESVAVIRLDEAENLVRLPVRDRGEDGHDHKHAHGKHGAGMRGEDFDPHFWLDPDNGKAIIQFLGRRLGALYPASQASIDANVAAAIEAIEGTAARLRRELEPLAGRKFLVFHDAYQYFEKRFGLVSAGAIAIRADVAPGARQLTRLRGRLRSEGIVCVFSEPQFDPKIATVLVEGTSARVAVLDPVGAALAPGPLAYVQLLDGMSRGFRSCLGDNP